MTFFKRFGAPYVFYLLDVYLLRKFYQSELTIVKLPQEHAGLRVYTKIVDFFDYVYRFKAERLKREK